LKEEGMDSSSFTYSRLIEVLKRPALYEKSEAKFWDDPYISSQMLKAHLDPDFEGASRSPDFIDRSVSWIRAIVAPENYPRLLDIGCGPGLYTERFAWEGYRVTGIDLSQRSIEHARASAKAHGLDISYRKQDYLDMDETELFDVCTMIYCDYGALSTEDRAKLLHNVHSCLKPGGIFLFDVWTKRVLDAFVEKLTWEVCEGNGFWRKERYLQIDGYHRYSDSVSVRHATIVTDTSITPYYIWDTYFTKEMIEEEARRRGFKLHGVFADVTGTPISELSDTMAVLLIKE
jgi:SAM-dependent methyltransferase